jgi:alpha-galactosidase/6-phospho-beta-glucosidase family protein
VGQSPAGKNVSTEAVDSVGICHQAMTGEDRMLRVLSVSYIDL